MSLPALAIGLANVIFGMKRRVQVRPGHPCSDALLLQPPSWCCAGCGPLLVPWSWARRDALGGSAEPSGALSSGPGSLTRSLWSLPLCPEAA